MYKLTRRSTSVRRILPFSLTSDTFNLPRQSRQRPPKSWYSCTIRVCFCVGMYPYSLIFVSVHSRFVSMVFLLSYDVCFHRHGTQSYFLDRGPSLSQVTLPPSLSPKKHVEVLSLFLPILPGVSRLTWTTI